MNVLMFVPDSLHKPMGGMGVQLAGILNGAQAAGLSLRFLIVGSGGERQDGENFVYVPHVANPVVNIPTSHVRTMIGFSQANYVDTGFWLADTEGPVDIVHAFDHSTAYAGIIVARRLRVPLVVTFQLSYATMALKMSGMVGSKDADYANMTIAIEMAMCREAAAIIQVSEAYKQFWAMLAPDAAEKMVVIPNATAAAQPIQPKPEYLETGMFNVGYIGRCCVQKAADAMIEAVFRPDWPSGVRLVWAGDERGGIPGIWRKLQDIARDYPDRLLLVGYLSGDAKWAFLQHCDAILFPSRHEPFGIVGLEAMTAGTVLITSRVDGIAEYADDTNSVLTAQTTDGILDAVSRTVALTVEQRRTLIGAGLGTAGRYRWDSIAGQLEGVYRRATGRCVADRGGDGVDGRTRTDMDEVDAVDKEWTAPWPPSMGE